jgi:hypothetical protein
MGVDLTLVPDRLPQNWWLAYDRLGTHRDYTFQAAIKALPSTSLPETIRFDWYDDDGIKHETEDSYGDSLRFVYARAFRGFDASGFSHWNRAVVAFCQTLEPETRIVLWWH